MLIALIVGIVFVACLVSVLKSTTKGVDGLTRQVKRLDAWLIAKEQERKRNVKT